MENSLEPKAQPEPTEPDKPQPEPDNEIPVPGGILPPGKG